MAKLLKRSDVAKKYKWNLEVLLAGATIDELIAEIKKLDEEKYKLINDFFSSEEKFDLWLAISEKIGLISNRLYNYVSNKSNENVTDNDNQKNQQKVSLFFNDISQKYANLENIILNHKADIDKLLILEKYEFLRHNYNDLFLSKKHILSESEEKLMSRLSLALSNNHDIFATLTDGDFNFGKIKDSTGKEHFLLQGNFSQMLKNKDRCLRENAFNRFWTVYQEHKNTLAKTLYGHQYNTSIESKIRHFNSSVEMQTFGDKIDDKFLEQLYSSVQKQTPLFKKYFRYNKIFLKAKLGLSKLEPWDQRMDLIDNLKIKFSKEVGIDLIKEAVKPLGKEYSSVLEKALNDNWIDFETFKGKTSGAYSIGASFGLDKKYILMNWSNNFNSVSTLAHELGHSMHSYFSDTYQDYYNSQYPIILAEIASTFNEVLLAEHLLKTSDDIKLKFYILNNLLNTFVGTVHRQTLWSNYEYNVFKNIDQDKPMVFEDYAKIYTDNLRVYYGWKETKKIPKYSELGSVYVPHFYYNFYVYKYAVGIISALSFVGNYHSGKDANLDTYINKFLKSGSSDYPLETLSKAGVDLKSADTYDSAFNYFDKLLTEYIKLGKQIFKK